MAKYAWCSDIHLDHLHGDEDVAKFSQVLVNTGATGVFITGDISSKRGIEYHLKYMEAILERPMYYVLGNHDYYFGDIAAVRKSMSDITKNSQYLRYLPTTSYVPLSQTTALIGHDGWYDALYADPLKSTFMMSDWYLIKEFVEHSGGAQFMQMQGKVKDMSALADQTRRLAHEGVTHVMNGIKSAVRYHKNIIVMTHFPPFKESHMYKGTVGDDNAMPWFTSKMMGDMLLDASRTYQDVNFTVLAGHTHGQYEGQIANNLHVKVAGADYGYPGVAGMIEVP